MRVQQIYYHCIHMHGGCIFNETAGAYLIWQINITNKNALALLNLEDLKIAG